MSVLQWQGADVIINRGGFNLFGANARVLDQTTGLNAFRNLARNESFFTLDDGYVMNIPGNFTNAGVNNATSGASITLNLNASARTPELNIAGNFQNDGSVELKGNTLMSVAGDLTSTGTIFVSGTQNEATIGGNHIQDGGELGLGSSGDFTLIADAHSFNTASQLTGSGTLEGNVSVSSASLKPGAALGQITVDGDLVLGAASLLEIELGGTIPITGHDRIRQIQGSNGTTLGGELSVDFANGFFDLIQSTDTFTILTSDLPLAGSFTNVANGNRLNTADGDGSFLVSYSGSSVVLSDFQKEVVGYYAWIAAFPVPEGEDEPLDDPNGDGVSNIEAYVRGMVPV